MNSNYLRTNRLKISPLFEKDYGDYKQFLSKNYNIDNTNFNEIFNQDFDTFIKEKYNLFINNYEYSAFCTIWFISLNSTNKLLGYIYFDGPPNKNKMVNIKYKLFNNYRNNNYESESIDIMTRWAFNQKNVIMSLYTLQRNLDYERKVIKNAGYLFWDEHATMQGFEVFCREKSNKRFLKIIAFISVSIGMIFGLIIHYNSFKMGLIFLIFGFIIGMIIDDISYRKNYYCFINELNDAKITYGEDNIPRNRIEYKKEYNQKSINNKSMINNKKIDHIGIVIKIVIIVIFVILALYFNYKKISIR